MAKYTIAQGIIWAAMLIATSIALTSSGSHFVIIPILAGGAGISISIQAKSLTDLKSTDGTKPDDAHSR